MYRYPYYPERQSSPETTTSDEDDDYGGGYSYLLALEADSSSNSYPIPQTCTSPILHLSEEDSNRYYTGGALYEVLEQRWRAKFKEAHIDTNSPIYHSWLSFFGRSNVSYGTVHAWAKAVCTCPLMFFLPDPHPEFGLRPEYFDEFLEVIEGCDAAWDSNCKIDGAGNIVLEDETQFIRRVWDIQANRVIPRCWVPQVKIDPISHAWVADHELQYVWSPVNYKQWGIPMPRGVTLEMVRENLLQYGVEYSWLDVLCLRQAIIPGSDVPIGNDLIEAMERRRKKEWLTDVPLIGGVYQSAKIVTYLNGLGRLYQPDADCTHPRHWLKRAWTLQESPARSNMALGGWWEGGSVAHPLATDLAGAASLAVAQGLQQLAVKDSYERLFEMKNRHASNPLDKIAGLFFPLRHIDNKRIPTYVESESQEDAWSRLINAVADTKYTKGIALFLMAQFPHPSANHWFPSWGQVMGWPDINVADTQKRREDHVPPPNGYKVRLQSGGLYEGWTLERYKPNSSDDDLQQIELRENKTLEYYMLKPPTIISRLFDGMGVHVMQCVLLRSIAAEGSGPELPHVDIPGAYVLVRLEVDRSLIPAHWRTAGPSEVGTGMIGTRPWHIFLVCRDVTKWRPVLGAVRRRYLRRITTLLMILRTTLDDPHNMDELEKPNEFTRFSDTLRAHEHQNSTLIEMLRYGEEMEGDQVGGLLAGAQAVCGESITAQSHVFLE